MKQPRRDPNAVLRWAAPMLTQAHDTGPIPFAGSPEWAALPNDDPRKAAAVVLTALVELHASTPAAIAAKRRAELDEIERTCRERIRSGAHDLSISTTWAAIGPSYQDLERRRSSYTTPALNPEQIRAGATVPWTCDQPQERVA